MCFDVRGIVEKRMEPPYFYCFLSRCIITSVITTTIRNAHVMNVFNCAVVNRDLSRSICHLWFTTVNHPTPIYTLPRLRTSVRRACRQREKKNAGGPGGGRPPSQNSRVWGAAPPSQNRKFFEIWVDIIPRPPLDYRQALRSAGEYLGQQLAEVSWFAHVLILCREP